MNTTCRNVVSLCRSAVLAALPLLVLCTSTAQGAPSPFELDVRELDRHKAAAPVKKEKPRPSRKPAAKTSPHKATAASAEVDTSRLIRYTVKSGDHIFKILMKEFGLSNDEAERLIPAVAHINKIGNVRKLDIGQVLLLPSPQTAAKRSYRTQKPATVDDGVVTRRTEEMIDPPPAVALLPAPAPTPTPTPALEPEPEPEPEPSPAPAPALEPEPGPAPEPEPVSTAAKEAAPPSDVTQQVAVTPPVTVLPPVAIVAPAVPAAPPARYPVKVVEIRGQHGEELVDSMLKALGLESQKMRVVDLRTGPIERSAFSIKVDRYIDHGGKRIIINCTDKDQFNYTLLRLLEQEGYRVIFAERNSFREVAGALLAHLDKPYEYVVRKAEGSAGTETKGKSGFLVGDGMDDVQLFLADPNGNGLETIK